VHGRSLVISIEGPKQGYGSFYKNAYQVVKTIKFGSKS
jgi:hypothetical protein